MWRHLQQMEPHLIGPLNSFVADFLSGKNQNGLSSHKTRLHKLDSDEFECPTCTRRYRSKKNLDRHVKACSGIPPPNVKPTWSISPTDGKYRCSFPGCTSTKAWNCSASVWKHFNNEHADIKDECYRFVNGRQLR